MVFVASVLVLLLAGVVQAGDVQVLEQIVAKVNGEIITTNDLSRAREQVEAELRARGTNGSEVEKTIQEREKNILRDKIDQLLLVQKGKDLNINVDSDLAKQLAEIQLQNKIADQDEFQRWIREQAGIPFEDFKAEMKNNILTRQVISREVGSKINIPTAEAKKYYDEHKDEFIREERVFLREILISTEGKDPKEIPALEKKAKDLVERARNGERFGDLARDHSDSISARNYGQLGAFKRSDLRKEIADIVFSHDKNYITDPIRVPNGFEILKIDDRHEAGLAGFEEVQNEVMEKLYMPLYEPAIRTYLTELRKQAFLQIRDGYVDTGAAPGKDTSWTLPAELKPETVTKEEVQQRTRRKRLLWLIPIPGTKATVKSKSDQ
jgi:peptidyl-prolyl cis-trans isomerase SurA